MTSARTTSLIGFVLLANLVALSVPALEMPTLDPACVFQKPILCAELPHDGAELRAVLADPANPLARWRRQIYWDMPFLVLYFAIVALTALRDGERGGRRLAMLAAVLMGVGALLDAVENTGILSAIADVEAGNAVSDGTASWVRIASLSKFLFLCAGCAIGLGFAFRDAPWVARTPLGLGIVACALVLVGLVSPPFIEVGALGIVAACLAAWVRSGLQWRREIRAWSLPSEGS
ncbi:MAG: hypothetical protein AB8I08_08570 [Sandaracinaceae bacterium]